MKLDLIIGNARILTVDAGRPRASSVGIWNGAVVGLDEAVDGMAAHQTVDLAGAVVTPGFHDAHCHSTSFGLELAYLQLGAVRGIDATLAAVADHAAGLGADDWVIGFGYGNDLAPDRYPDRLQLDRAGGGRPVWLTHRSGHSCVVSSAVLDRVGITGARDHRARGRVVVDDAGRPTGLIEEAAMDLVKDHVGPSSIEQLAEAIGQATSHYATEGITGFTDAGIGCPGIDHSPVELAAYQLARDTDRLHIRAQVMVHNELFHEVGGHRQDRIATGLDLGMRTGLGDDRLSLGAMKVWVDGSGLGGSAATTGSDGSPRGNFDNDPDLLRRAIIDAHRAGWQVAAHAIGDRAVDLVLDALEEASAGGPYPARAGNVARHRIEHGLTIRPDQVERLARLSMTVVIQPSFVTEFGDGLLQRYRDDRRLANYFRTRSLAAAGVAVVGSSDRPVAVGSPLVGMQAMVERRTGNGEPFTATERFSPEEALASYTVAGATAAHREHRWGRLAPGQLADLVVLDGDPTDEDRDRIGDIGVLATLVEGRPVHDPAGRFDGVVR